MTTVFVVDDEREMVDLIAIGLKKRGFTIIPFTSGADAVAAIAQHDVDVVITDLNMKGMTGLQLCEQVAADRPDIPVLMLTAFGSFETAVGAIRAGAYDFVTKPVEIEALAIAVRRAAEHRALRGEVKRLREAMAAMAGPGGPGPYGAGRGRGDLIGASPSMQRVYELIDQVSSTDASVLLSGESGTGKESVAREIHARSRRSTGRFLSINCAALSEQMLENELFRAGGAFEQAQGGTLFLDEIGEMALALQPRLLLAIQERKFRPLGGDGDLPVDVRLIAATNRDLEEMVEAKQFREDLYYRIHVIHIPMPPLRARGGDVLLLAGHFIRHYANVLDKKVIGLSNAAAERLMTHEWPGNVRELANAIERAVSLTHFEELQVDDLPDKIRTARPHPQMSGTELAELLTLEEVERRHVLRVLAACKGNRTDAAKMLDLDRKTLYRKLLRWGVSGD